MNFRQRAYREFRGRLPQPFDSHIREISGIDVFLISGWLVDPAAVVLKYARDPQSISLSINGTLSVVSIRWLGAPSSVNIAATSDFMPKVFSSGFLAIKRIVPPKNRLHRVSLADLAETSTLSRSYVFRSSNEITEVVTSASSRYIPIAGKMLPEKLLMPRISIVRCVPLR